MFHVICEKLPIVLANFPFHSVMLSCRSE